MGNFTLDEARQIALAATGPRKKLPFTSEEELLAALQGAEAVHDNAVFDFEITAEDSRQRQLLLDFAPAVRKVYSLWRELAVPGRRTILAHCDEACPENDGVRRQLANSAKDGLEKELLLEFLPAFAEASLHPRMRRARDAERATSNENKISEDVCLESFEEVIEGRVFHVIGPRDGRWKIYDIALKRLQHGAELAVQELAARGRHRPKELAGLEAFTRFIAKSWIAAPTISSVAEFSSKFDHVSGSDGQTEYLPKSPASKFIWAASKYLQPPYIKGDPFEERRYSVQNCETVMDYVRGDPRGEKLESNS